MKDEGDLFIRPMLWGGLLAPAIAWALHLSLSYLLATTLCPGSAALHVLTVILLTAAVAGGWMAWTKWSRLDTKTNDVSEQRIVARFLALIGMLFAGLFALAIVAQWIPVAVMEPCV